MIQTIASFFVVVSSIFSIPARTQAAPIPIPEAPKPIVIAPIKKTEPTVPFYSQFKDIDAPEWKKVGCGVASLAMIVNYYQPDAVSVNTLLKRGIASGAYLNNVGWTYKGLISLSNRYNLAGESYDLAKIGSKAAFAQFEAQLKNGPVIASVHYKFEPQNPIPHLVVINKIENDTLYYNDPAAQTGSKTISVADFVKAWKKRYIVIRPLEKNDKLALARI